MGSKTMIMAGKRSGGSRVWEVQVEKKPQVSVPSRWAIFGERKGVKNSREQIDECDTYGEASQLRLEYISAFGPEWVLSLVEVKGEES